MDKLALSYIDRSINCWLNASEKGHFCYSATMTRGQRLKSFIR